MTPTAQDPGAADVSSEEPPGVLRLVVVLVGLQSLGLLGIAVFYVVELVASRPSGVVTALTSAILAVAAGLGLGMVARGLARRRRWSRAPALVAQLLCLPVAWDLAHSERWYVGVPLLVWAVALVVLLFSPPVSAALVD